MRFMPSKFQCPPFICFCKSSQHIYTPGPLKLENSHHVPSMGVSVSDESSRQLPAEVKNGTCDEKPIHYQTDNGACIKSSLKTKNKQVEVPHEVVIEAREKRKRKKRVQWMDFIGKELVEIREFDSCEADEIDPRRDGSNLCVIL